VSTPEKHRAEAADYTDLAEQGNASNEVRKFLRHEQSLIILADNEQWLADNHDNLANNLDKLVPVQASSSGASAAPRDSWASQGWL
jgi:hypothetical protein